MSRGTPVFPDLGYAISRSNVVSVGFSDHHHMNPHYTHQQYPQYPQYAYSNPSPNSSPQSQASTIAPPNLHYQQPLTPVYQAPPASQIPTQTQPRSEFKRRKTEPNVAAPLKPQGNRRIPRVIAAAAPKAVQKNRQDSGAHMFNVNDPRAEKAVWNEVERQKGSTGPQMGVFGYVFDADD